MRTITLIAGLIVVLASCTAPAPPATDPAVERAAVERAITQWFDSGLAVGDTTVIRRGLTPTVAILEDSIWYDQAGFVKFVQSLPTLVGGPFTLRYSLTDWKTTVHGDVAWTSLPEVKFVVQH